MTPDIAFEDWLSQRPSSALEIERLTKENAALRAEVERLKQAWADDSDDYEAVIADDGKLEMENDTLRARVAELEGALKKIATGDHDGGVMQFARAALEKKP